MVAVIRSVAVLIVRAMFAVCAMVLMMTMSMHTHIMFNRWLCGWGRDAITKHNLEQRSVVSVGGQHIAVGDHAA